MLSIQSSSEEIVRCSRKTIHFLLTNSSRRISCLGVAVQITARFKACGRIVGSRLGFSLGGFFVVVVFVVVVVANVGF